jgi:hypothetical protein
MRSPDWQSEDGRHRMWCGDNAEILPGIVGEFDSVVSDPPYGIKHPCSFAKRGRGKLAKCRDWPDVAGDEKPFDPAPILSLGVPTILWGANHFANKLPASNGWLVWDKKRPDDLDQSTCELAWTNCVKGVRRFEHMWNGFIKASERGGKLSPNAKARRADAVELVAAVDARFSGRRRPIHGFRANRRSLRVAGQEIHGH